MSNWKRVSLTVSMLVIIASVVPPTIAVQQGTNKNETEALIFLDYVNAQVQIEAPIAIEAVWTYNTNITQYNMQKMVRLYYDACEVPR